MKLPFGLTGIWGWAVVGLAALALVAAITVGVVQCKKIDAEGDNVLINSGVTQERAATQGKVLDNVKKADDAVRAPTAAERQRVCDKYDRNCTPSGK